MLKKLLYSILTFSFLLPSFSLITMEQPKMGIRLSDVVNKDNAWQAAKFSVPAVLAYSYLDKQEKNGNTVFRNKLGKIGVATSAGVLGWAGLTAAEHGAQSLWDYAKKPLCGLAAFTVFHKFAKWGIGRSTRSKIEKAISLDNKIMLFNWKRNEDAYDSSYKLKSISSDLKGALKMHARGNKEEYAAKLKELTGNRSINFSGQIEDTYILNMIMAEEKLLDTYIKELQSIRFGIPYGEYKTGLIVGENEENYGLQSLKERDELRRKVKLSDIELDSDLSKWPELKKQNGQELRYVGKLASFRKNLFEYHLIKPCTDVFFSIKNKIRSCKDFLSMNSPVSWQSRTYREWLKREADWVEPYYFSNYLVLPWLVKTVLYPARTEIFDLIITLKELKARLDILKDLINGRSTEPQLKNITDKEAESYAVEEEDDDEGSSEEEV